MKVSLTISIYIHVCKCVLYSYWTYWANKYCFAKIGWVFVSSKKILLWNLHNATRIIIRNLDCSTVVNFLIKAII